MADPTVSRHPGQHATTSVYVERRGRLELTNVSFTRRKAPAADHRQDRLAGRPPHRRVEPDGRRPPARRLARQRHHPAAGARRPDDVDPPLRRTSRCKMDNLVATCTALTPEMASVLEGLRQGEGQHAHLGRHRRRQDHAAQHPVRLHPARPSASSPSRTPPSCSCSSRTWCAWKRARRTSKARARSPSARWCATRCACGPDRIIIGEVRGAEALDMLQAMNTGHEGSMTTIHANTPRDALSRLENMVGMADLNLPHKAIAPADRLGHHVVHPGAAADRRHAARSPASRRSPAWKANVITMQEIFAFRQTGVDADGKVEGHFQATGVRPKFCERLRAFGHRPARCDIRPARATTSRSEIMPKQSIAAGYRRCSRSLVFVAVILLLEGMYLLWRTYRAAASASKIEQRLTTLSAARRRRRSRTWRAAHAERSAVARALPAGRAARARSSTGCCCRRA